MPFIPLESITSRSSPADFPRVSAAEQAERDAQAEQIVAGEFDQDMPAESRAALEAEYRQRFDKEPPSAPRGFIPLGNAAGQQPARGFIPLKPAEPEEPEQRSTLRNVLLNNPATAIGETALNLGTQAVALPVAGIAGLATEAGRALGFTDGKGADVVHAVGNALTYQPRGELGKAATEAAMYPFEKLAEAGQYVGGKVLDATGSPLAAAAADTAINAIPMMIAPAAKGAKAIKERVVPKAEAPRLEPRGFIPLTDADAMPAAIPARGATETGRGIPEPTRAAENAAAADLEPRGFVSWSEVEDGQVQARAQRVVRDETPMSEAGEPGLEILRRQGRDDLSPVAGELQELPGGPGPGAESAALAGATQHGRQLRANELRLDDPAGAGAAPRLLPEGDYLRPGDDGSGGRAPARAAEEGFRAAPRGERLSPRESAGREALPSLGVADAQRRDASFAGMGEADRAAVRSAVAEGPARDAAGAGLDAGALPEPKTARWALVEADDLKPRDLRGGLDWYEREKVIQDVNRKFDPARLAEALDDAEGAPVIARDGVVEAGHKRAVALQRVYQANGQKAVEYRQHLRDNATRFGLAPEQIDGMKKPVLVRVPDEPAPRRAAGAEPVRAQVGEPTDAMGFRPLDHGATVQDMAGDVQNGTWNPGAHYTPFVDQVRPPVASAKSVADLPAPIRREKILGDLAKALGTTIYEGRVKGQKRLGFFRPKLEEVRIKKANDIEVAAHEVAHLIDKRVPAIANAWRTDKALREELKSVSYDQKSVPEGFAEGMRLFLTQPETLQAKAPKVHAWLESFAREHEYGPALRKAQDRMTAWFEQDALNRARSKIGQSKPLSEYLDGAWDKFRQATVDDLHGVYRLERDLTGKINPVGPYESARLSRASASIADGVIRYGAPEKRPDGSFRFKGKGLEEILKPVAESLDDALLYFVGRSARELQAQGREHLFSPGEIDGMLRLRTPEREAAFKGYQVWNKGILDFAEAQGVINPESRARWQRQAYLPFHRVGQSDGFKGKPGDWSGIKALTGGTENIRDVLGNMVGNAAQLIDKAVKNEARLKIADLAEKQGGGRFMVKIDPESRPVRVDSQQVLDGLLKALGIDRHEYAARGEKLPKHVQKIIKGLEEDLAKSPGFEFLVGGQPPAGKNVVAVLRGGKPTWYEVGDPILMRALEAIDRPAQHWLVRLLGMPKRVGQATITLTLDFMAANIARDTLMGAVMSRTGFKPVIDSLQGMRLRITSDPIYKDFIANGGGLSSIYLDEAKLRTKLEKFYGRRGIDYRTVLDSPAKLLSFIETMSDAFEMSTRLGEFRRAVQRGENPRHAAYLGREVSTDFAMKGDSKALGFMYDTVMFLRPAVVSMDRLARGLAHDPNKGAIAAKSAALALASVGLYLLNRNDPRYADLPDWDRDTHWHFFIGDQHFRYPKIWEIGALASIAERITEKLMAEDPAGLGKDFVRIVGQTFNLNLMPQILAPLYEQATNRNSFTKAPIETPGMENLQPFLRAKPGTSETMRAAGMATRDLPESLQVNPVRTEALLRGYLNTWGMYGLMLTDRAFFSDKLPESRTDQLPVVRRFYSQEPPQHTKFESQFYDMLQEAQRLRGTLKELDKMGRSDLADQKEKSPLAGEAKPLERGAKNLSDINADMRDVRRNAALTPEQKRAKLDALTVDRNALLKGAVLEAQKAQKEKTQ